MSLLTALSNARASLASVSTQSALVSRNIAHVDDPTASRKYANLSTSVSGGVEIRSVARSSDPALYRSLINTTASLGASKVQADALDRLHDAIGDVDSSTSPAASLAALRSALSQYAATPENSQLAANAVQSAKDVASSLNDASDAVQTMRRDADAGLDEAAKSMNSLLSELETVNAKVVAGTGANADVTDAVDRRDHIVAELSTFVGLNIRTRGGNDLVLSTDSGITLFERTARQVSFSASSDLAPGVAGNTFKIDGVAVFGPDSPMPVRSGKLAALSDLRDKTAVTVQGQLDALAGSLVRGFAETSKDPADTVRYAGLFVDAAGGPLADGAAPGLAARLAVAASVDPSRGGSATRLRDGGISHPDDTNFVANTAGAPGFTAYLNDLSSRFDQQHDFDAALGAGGQATFTDYAAATGGWIEGRRSGASADADYSDTLLSRTRETLSNRTGVNLDEEMTRLLDLERSYQASSKLISTVGKMFDQLLNIV